MVAQGEQKMKCKPYKVGNNNHCPHCLSTWRQGYTAPTECNTRNKQVGEETLEQLKQTKLNCPTTKKGYITK